MRKLLLGLLLCTLASIASAQNLVYHPDYVPPPCVEGFYTDTTCDSLYTAWAEQLFREGITVGTGHPGDPIPSFSPSLPIPREQEAVFVLRAEHSILERFAVGQVTCPPQSWAKCQGTVSNPRVHASSVVMMTYRTRGDDTQIPARVITISDGSFTYEIQTGQTADYLAYVADEFPPIDQQ